jgi:hypothetical protein
MQNDWDESVIGSDERLKDGRSLRDVVAPILERLHDGIARKGVAETPTYDDDYDISALWNRMDYYRVDDLERDCVAAALLAPGVFEFHACGYTADRYEISREGPPEQEGAYFKANRVFNARIHAAGVGDSIFTAIITAAHSFYPDYAGVSYLSFTPHRVNGENFIQRLGDWKDSRYALALSIWTHFSVSRTVDMTQFDPNGGQDVGQYIMDCLFTPDDVTKQTRGMQTQLDLARRIIDQNEWDRAKNWGLSCVPDDFWMKDDPHVSVDRANARFRTWVSYRQTYGDMPSQSYLMCTPTVTPFAFGEDLFTPGNHRVNSLVAHHYAASLCRATTLRYETNGGPPVVFAGGPDLNTIAEEMERFLLLPGIFSVIVNFNLRNGRDSPERRKHEELVRKLTNIEDRRIKGTFFHALIIVHTASRYQTLYPVKITVMVDSDTLMTHAIHLAMNTRPDKPWKLTGKGSMDEFDAMETAVLDFVEKVRLCFCGSRKSKLGRAKEGPRFMNR